MKYLDPKFSSRPATDAYRANYDRTFRKPKTYVRRMQTYTIHGPVMPICEKAADAIEDGLRRGVGYGLPVFVVKSEPKPCKYCSNLGRIPFCRKCLRQEQVTETVGRVLGKAVITIDTPKPKKPRRRG